MRIAFGSAFFLFISLVFYCLFILNNQLRALPIVFDIHIWKKNNFIIRDNLQKYIIFIPYQSFTQKNINNTLLENI